MAAAAHATEAPPSFLCPISLEIMRDPVSTVDGHCYERTNIEYWLASGARNSPKTGAVLPSTTLTRNHALRNAIEEWELANCQLIRRADITPSAFNRSTQIGAGSFKEVHKAEMVRAGASTAIPVAVLKVRRGDIAEEAEMLLGLGRHPHLVRCFGICRDGDDDLIITEFAAKGALDALVSDLEDDGESIPFQHKVVILTQVVSGMKALADAGVIHRDLATRNVLVFGYDAEDITKTAVKVSDFGLAVNAYTVAHAYVQGDALPIRYLSVEALKKHKYSEKSDVWAFGVLAWELLTDGETPYFRIPNDAEVIVHVVDKGGRLDKPPEEACPSQHLWDNVVTPCWEKLPKNRPTFAQLAIGLGQLHANEAAAELAIELGRLNVAEAGTAEAAGELGVALGQLHVSDDNATQEDAVGALAIGTRVRVRGLTSETAVHLNGQYGLVDSRSAEDGRVGVKFESDGKLRAVRFKNIKPATADDDAAAAEDEARFITLSLISQESTARCICIVFSFPFLFLFSYFFNV